MRILSFLATNSVGDCHLYFLIAATFRYTNLLVIVFALYLIELSSGQ